MKSHGRVTIKIQATLSPHSIAPPSFDPLLPKSHFNGFPKLVSMVTIPSMSEGQRKRQWGGRGVGWACKTIKLSFRVL